MNEVYFKIFGENIPIRNPNHINENVYRKDFLYERLTKRLIFDKENLLRILNIFKKIKANNVSELSLISYIYAINNDYINASNIMLEIIQKENGENIDSWIDYAHFIRKIDGEGNNSIKILLKIKKIIQDYNGDEITKYLGKVL